MKKKPFFPLFIFILLIITGISHADYQILIDHTCTNLSQIPVLAISQAKSNLHIAYQHTSHGSQLITGMNALKAYPDFGKTYEFSDNGLSGLDLDDDGIPGAVEDLSQGDYIDGNGVTPWVTSTRKLLDNTSNKHINVIIWSWCSINGHDAQRYVDNMEILISEYGLGGSKVSPTRPAVQFIFMTGHAEGQGEDPTPDSVDYNNELIRTHCRNNNRILFDFADIEAFSPGNPDLKNPGYQYFWDLDMQDNLDYTGGNWATEWLSLYPGSELAKLTTGDGVDGYQGCSDCAHSSSPSSANLNCVLKGRACWWLWARLAGWQGPVSCAYSISPSSGSFTSSGGTGSVSITASSSACAWTASESLSWVSLSPTSGTGNGTVKLTIGPNTDATRFGSVIIADQTYIITQSAALPLPPTLGSPANNANVAGTSVRLSWNASSGASEYWLWVRRTSDKMVIFNQTVGNTISYNLTGLTDNGDDYFWIVRAGNSSGWSKWCNAGRFFNNTAPIPSPPILSSPANNTNVAGTSVRLSWNASSGASEYWLWVRRTSDKMVIFNQTVGNSISYNLTGLTDNGDDYFWIVRAGNSSGWSKWCNAGRFFNGIAHALSISPSSGT